MPSTISAGTTAGTAIAIAGDTTGNLAFQTNGTTTAMTITTGQNVGIGTASPSRKLDIVSTASTTPRITGSSNEGGYLDLHNNAQTTGRFRVGQGYGTGSDNIAFLNNESNAALVFGTNNTERMRIDSAGRVTTPNQPAFFALFNEGGSSGTPRTSEWSGSAYAGTAFNIGNNFSGGRFTAPVAGLYYFHFWVQEETFYGQWNNPVSIYWWKNGSANFSYGLDSPGIPSAYDEFWIAGSIIVQLAANDTFSASLYAPNSTVGGNPWVSTELNSGGFMGYLIG